jgi:cytochrome P450
MTSILDSALLPWDDGRVQRLYEELCEAYTDSDGIKELVEGAGGKLAGGINWKNSRGVNAIWRQVMENAAHACILRKLLLAALADRDVEGHHEKISSIMDELDGGDESEPAEEANPAVAEPISVAGLAAVLAADLTKLADQLIEQVQRLVSCSKNLDTALAAAAVAATTSSIRKTLNSIDDIGIGKAAETPLDDADNALRQEIRRQLDLCARLLPKVTARHDDTTSTAALAVAAGRLRMSALRLAGLRERQQRTQ